MAARYDDAYERWSASERRRAEKAACTLDSAVAVESKDGVPPAVARNNCPDMQKSNDASRDAEADFRAYYESQKLFASRCSTDADASHEFEQLMRTLRSPLPRVVRVPQGNRFVRRIEKRLSEFSWKMRAGFGDGEASRRAAQADTVWEIDASAYRGPLRTWAEREGNRGALVFQELVSQVPPLLLDVKRGHAVLDMCASPGNKTRQIAERLGDCLSAGAGAVVAADVDPTRACKVLGHALRRTYTPGSLALIANARTHPYLYEPRMELKDECMKGGSQASGEQILYDRILADVPCTGDGTCRKDREILNQSWSRKAALELHQRQQEILLRGLTLLKPGGILVYSTCSFNPIENEAVVARALCAWRNGQSTMPNWCIELLDAKALVRDRVGIVAASGLKTWLVPSPDPLGRLYACWEDVPEHLRAGCGGILSSGMFATNNPANAELERCARFFPHDNDTGGFFVAVIRISIIGENMAESKCEGGKLNKLGDLIENADWTSQAGVGRPLGWEPTQHIGSWYERVRGDEPEWEEMKSFYGFSMSTAAETALRGGLLYWRVSCPSHERRELCIASAAAARRYEASLSRDAAEGAGEARSLPWVRMGVSLFERLRETFLTDTRAQGGRSLTPCRWRPCEDGARLLAPHLSSAESSWLHRRTLLIEREDVCRLLSCRSAGQQLPLSELRACGESLFAACCPSAADSVAGTEGEEDQAQHECGGVLVGIAGDGLGSPSCPEGAVWLPGVLTPRQLRLFVEPLEAAALAEVLGSV
eukprot:TRINITY_DN29028_c0_g1_i1.p1 TRINITY_DN29028_c0_g1~~TRINITY_DN29028_c0_g1_i1.p1  ORF type:complete len:870 (+),score=116.27 TRINITY_DN29028_c0_g1_i1:307-2610(+)